MRAYNWGRGTAQYYGDQLSVYLHAGFHLISSSSSNKKIFDSALYNAAAPLAGLPIPVFTEEQKSSIVGAAFATECGPGIKVPPPAPRRRR